MVRKVEHGQAFCALALACLAALFLPAFADAAWLGYRNDTTVPVVIQSATIVNNQLRWGKPHSLFPGEIAWDAVPSPGGRIVGVFDPKKNNLPVYQEAVTVGSTDIFLSLQMVTPPARGQPQQPQPKFIPTKPPSNPPGGPTPRQPQTPPGIPGNPPNQKPPANPGTPGNPNPNPNTPPAPKPPSNPPGKSGGN
jgi:hypothetical protein